MFTKPIQQPKHNTQKLVSKIPSLTCFHTLYNNTNINTKARCKNAQSYMCTYPLQQKKHKHKGSLPKLSVLHVLIPSLHVYIPSTKAKKRTRSLFAKITSLTCVHTLYNKTNIKTKACFTKCSVLHV